MKKVRKLSTVKRIRAIHRDVGALVVGLTLIFCISGIILIYRDSGFLTFETQITKTLQPDLNPSAVKNAIKIRRFQVQENSETHIVFRSGQYDKTTGVVTYTVNKHPKWIAKMINMHKTDSRDLIHWISLIYGVLLLFLAISSIWMYQPGTKVFKRFLSFLGVGIALAILLISYV